MLDDLSGCMDLCCREPDSCRRCVCPVKAAELASAVREVDGFASRGFVASRQTSSPPEYIPLLRLGVARGETLDLRAGAVSLYDVLRAAMDGRITTPHELRHAIGLPDRAAVYLDAVGHDRTIEPLWAIPAKVIADALKPLQPTFVSTPNYSMFLDVPRHDNLINLRRIEISAIEFASVGLPVVCHIHGRTPRDYQRMAEFVKRSPGISVIAAEFGTMGRSPERKQWHAKHLSTLAQSVGRSLTIVARAGVPVLRDLRSAFGNVTRLDTRPLHTACQRSWAYVDGERLRWQQSPTRPDESIAKCLENNCHVLKAYWGAPDPS